MTGIAISAETPVGTITENLPGAVDVFRRAGIGYCCGGNETLAEAAAHHDVALDDLIADLEALTARSIDSPPAETGPLIDHIITRFHTVHREELEWLVPLAEKVEAVHADHDAAPVGLAETLALLRDDLDLHMKKEEQVLFPMMRNGGHPMIAHPIAVMRQDHYEADELMQRIRAITRDMSLPDDACRSWTALYVGLAKFAADLKAHVELENDVLFPRFESA